MSDEEQEQEDHLRANCEAVLNQLDPFESLLVTEANLSVLTSSDKGTHKATIWFNIEPSDLEIRDLANLVMPLHLHITYLYQLARDRLRIEDRDDAIRDLLEDDERGAEDVLADIQDLMDDA